ncbi:unnamed protein product, partial [Rotaria sp. Silwood2]
MWQGEWIAYMSEIDTKKRMNLHRSSDDEEQYIQLYSTRTGQTYPIALGKEAVHTFTWSNTSASLYFAARTPCANEAEEDYKSEWNDVIQYREQERGDTIYRINIEDITAYKIETLINISLRVAELICSPDGRRLLFSTSSKLGDLESMEDFEIYALDLMNRSQTVPIRLTNNQAYEEELTWFNNEEFFFTVSGYGSIEGSYKDSQGRLYSMNVINSRIERWADKFKGQIEGYALLQQGRDGVVILGQLGTEIQIYSQLSANAELIKRTGWNGSYESIVTGSEGNSSTIAFIHSSFDVPQEVYFINNINELSSAQAITSENKLFTERSLPKGKVYRWTNEEDKTEIEGILLYPPENFEQKNLPLLVLIHGGPYMADVNMFRAGWYTCAAMMATDGWLVLQPNYRGSSGYGDEFLNGMLLEIVSRPGKDILFGVDALIRDGIADSTRLVVGGYSYGGYLTNWLITQTTRFNAALSGAGAIEHVVDWGTNDIPVSNVYLLGGFPWQQPSRYQMEAAVYQLDKVCTPTHIIVGEYDVRVPVAEAYILERSLKALGVTTKLIVFPGEGHDIENNPWHEKIKVREELKWLHKY